MENLKTEDLKTEKSRIKKLQMKKISNWVKISEGFIVFGILMLKVFGVSDIEMSEVAIGVASITAPFLTVDFSVIQGNKLKAQGENK